MSVESDERVRRVSAQTEEETLAHFDEIVAGRPEPTGIARAEALPALLRLPPKAGVDVREPADDPDAPDRPEDGLWPEK